MLQRIKKLLEHNALLMAIIATVIIAVLSLSHLPKIDLGLHIKSSDKYLHALAYFTLSTVWLFALREKLNNKAVKIVLIVSLIFYGIVLEVLQNKITSFRTGDLFDEFANVVGISLAVLVFDKLLKWYNSI
jgi:VanZ family protein